jgi:D-alanine-D-alanine ligase
VLHDAHAAAGGPDAADVLREAQDVAHGLAALGYEPVTLPVGLDLKELEAALTALQPHVVFNLMESIGGRGQLIHIVPALLEALGIPFTGCSAHAQWTTSNKLAAKRRLVAAGIAAPELFALDSAVAAQAKSAAALAGPWIVKSVWEHASLGLDDDSVLADRRAVPAMLARRVRVLGGEWFAERYIAGRELNVALIAARHGPTVLPVAEIRFVEFPEGKPRIVGYAAKWHADSVEYARTVRSFDVDSALRVGAADIARECWDLFGLGGYARVDFRVDATGRLWVLEVNANPCLSADAGFAAMLDAAGIAFADALAWLIADALARRDGPHGARAAASLGTLPLAARRDAGTAVAS